MSNSEDFSIYSQSSDVIVMCHRPFKDYAFINNVPLVPLAGVPLIVRCLASWVACGFRRFYIVHDDDKVLAAIRNNFPKALLGDRPLQLVLVQLSSDPISEKEALRRVAAMREGPNKERDVIVTDCTTLVNKEDIVPLVTNFYASLASCSMLMWKPFIEKKEVKKGGKGQGKEAEEVLASDVPILAALEEECAGAVTIGGSSQQNDASHYRVHFLAPDAKEVPQLQMGFVARRPNLEFRYDLNDCGVYMFQSWMFELAIREMEGDGITATVREGLYFMVRCQHWAINRRPDTSLAVANPPSRAIAGEFAKGNNDVCPETHWCLAPQVMGPIARTPNLSYYGASFNAMQDVLPSAWDNLRIVTTVITDAKGFGRRVMCINRASDLALATADVACGLHYQVTNSAMQVQVPRAVCDGLYTVMLSTYVDDLKFKRNTAGQSNLKNSIVLTNGKTCVGKGTFTEGSFIADGAVIGDKVSLMNCIVLEGATVSNGAKLSHCLVKKGVTVPANTNASCQYFDN